MSKGASRPILARHASDASRALHKTEDRRKAAVTGEEIKRMHFYGHECSLSVEELAELRERVRHRPWRATW